MPAPHGLQRVIASRREALAEYLVQAVEGDRVGVHQARVASRRLREALPAVAAKSTSNKLRRLRRRIRRLTRAFGPVRELDVALQMVESHRLSHPEDAPALDALQPMLARERAARQAYSRHHVSEARARRMLQRLEAFEAALPPPQVSKAWRQQLGERLRRRANALHGAIADAGAIFLPERLHAVRIAVKKLRYALEVAGEMRIAATGAAVRQLKDAQEILGRLHDLDVIGHQVASLRASATWGAETESAFDSFSGYLVQESRALHARYLRRQTGLVSVADRTLDGVVPRLAAPATTKSRPRAPAARSTRVRS